MSGLAECQGGPYASITGPADPGCISMPANPICAGGPYALPAAPAMPAGPAMQDMPQDRADPIPHAPEMPDRPLEMPHVERPEMHIGGGMPGHI